MARANKYFEIAKKDPTQKQDAENFQLYAMRSSLKNHADSLAFVDQLKQMYAAEPENEVIVDAINGVVRYAQQSEEPRRLTRFR